jgi:hypothetical protein
LKDYSACQAPLPPAEYIEIIIDPTGFYSMYSPGRYTTELNNNYKNSVSAYDPVQDSLPSCFVHPNVEEFNFEKMLLGLKGPSIQIFVVNYFH